MLDKLREKSASLYEETKNERFKLISNILENDACFFDMPVETALSILSDLGYSKELAKKYYIALINNENL